MVIGKIWKEMVIGRDQTAGGVKNFLFLVEAKMASETPAQAVGNVPPEPSPAKRKRLKECFEYGNRIAAQENFDYAADVYTECVVGEPGNALYVQAFLSNLKKKFNNNKRGQALGFFKLAPLKAALKKAVHSKDWVNVFRIGAEALKINPWDTGVLTALSQACEQCGYHEAQLVYLKQALDANPKDVEMCRRCARTLAELKLYDQAIAMWHKVEQLKPNDPEAPKAIADLTVRKTIEVGGYDETGESRRRIEAAGGEVRTPDALSRRDRLEMEIKRQPTNLPLYYELAEIYVRDGEYARAEQLMAKAYEITKDVAAKEKLEDLQLRRLRQALAEAEKEYRSNPSDQTKQKMVAAQKALWSKELEVYKDRVERFPNNLAFRFELGVRYQLNEMYEEAIKQYQIAQTDPRRKGVCLLNLGQCFEKIGQHRLAMKHFEDAVQEISDRDAENKKRALYSAAVLAYRLKDYRKAEQHASALAAMDYSYRNVGELLDKIAKRLEAQRGTATAEEEAVEVELPPGQDEE